MEYLKEYYMKEYVQRLLDSNTYLHRTISDRQTTFQQLLCTFFKVFLLGAHSCLLFLGLMNCPSHFLEKGYNCVCQHQRVTGDKFCI